METVWKGMSEMEEVVLCGASAYNKKFYLNEDFKGLPEQIKNELKIMCVLFTEDVGGYGDHLFFHLLTFAGEFFLSHNTFPFLALIVFLIKGRVFS